MLSDLKAPLNAMLGSFLLTKADIEKVKKWVEAQWEKNQPPPPPIIRVSWVCLVKARQIHDEKVFPYNQCRLEGSNQHLKKFDMKE